MKPKSKPNMGSRAKANPLKSIKWLWRPKPTSKILNNLKPIRASVQIPNSVRSRLNPIELTQAMKGEMIGDNFGVVHLTFDIGLVNQIESIARTLKDRRNQTIGRPQKFGWGGQLAFDYYLNFFSEYAEFTVKADRPLGSPYPKPYDFLIGMKYQDDPETHFFAIEVKTSPYLSHTLNYVKGHNKPYPDYVVCVRALDETMMKYELYGWCKGVNIQKHKSVIRYGKKCHPIPLNRNYFDYYNYFHKWILGLPYLEKFDNEQQQQQRISFH